MEENYGLPTIADLHKDDPEIAFKQDALNYLLYQEPPKTWLRKHPIVTVKDKNGTSVKADYLPVDKCEYMLAKIFKNWRREILSVQQIFNAVQVTVRVHYYNPVSKEWSWHDGVGAVSVQTDKGASAADLSAIKSNAVQIATPAAASYALKDACECLGKLFGKDLNKYDTLAFKWDYSPNGEEPVADKEPESTSFTIDTPF